MGTRPVTRGFAVLVVVLCAASMAPLVGSAAAETESGSGINQVGTLPRFPADAVEALGKTILPDEGFKNAYGGTLVAVPQRHELWQIFPIQTAEATAPTLIAVRDMATLKIKSTIRITTNADITTSNILRGTSNDGGGDWMHAFDGNKRIFFMGSLRRTALSIDLDTHAIKEHRFGAPIVATGNFGVTTAGIWPGALAYDPFDDALVVVYAGPGGFSAGNTNTMVYRINLNRPTAPTAATDVATSAARYLRSCNGPYPAVETSQSSAVEILSTEQYYYIVCHRAGIVGTVVRLVRAELGSPSSAEDLAIGPVYVETVYADQVSGRLFLATRTGEIWAFDARTMSFVGVVAASAERSPTNRSGYGFDRVSGRLFFLSSTYGLGVAEGRFFPMEQARVRSDKKAPGQERIVSDPYSGRLFVMTGTGGVRDQQYTIYNAGPSAQPPSPPNPDVSTTDVAEKEGVTESRYFASGTGYGFRALVARGFVTIPPAPTLGRVAPTAEAINKTANSKCGYTDRELVGARVSKAEYDTGSTAARAVGVDVDDRTKVDLEHLKRCDVAVTNGGTVFDGLYSTQPFLTALDSADKALDRNPDANTDPTDTAQDPGKAWEFKGESCSSSAGEPPTVEESKQDDSTTTCPEPGKELVARATARFQGEISVGRSETVTKIRREATGVVSEVTAEAQDILVDVIPNLPINIGRITATATSRSNGRPAKTDMSEHKVTISGVRVGSETICFNNCNIEEVARRLTGLAGGKAEFRTVSGLDEGLRRGTPKGALTAVQKSVSRQASDQALIGDFTTEVPSFEIVMYNDNLEFGRARQLYQFAGVATAATYNIAVSPTGLGFGDDPIEDLEEVLDPDGAFAGFQLNDHNPSTTSPIASLKGRGDSIIERVVSAIGRGIRMFFSDPRQALLLLTAWALLTLPPFLSRRRRLLNEIRTQ